MSGLPRIAVRSAPPEAVERLIDRDIPPLLARLYAARGVVEPAGLAPELGRLLPPERMLNLPRMAQLLADAINEGRKLLIVADYDADGATACAVGLRGLRAFGANVDYLVPDRFRYGYGLTPEIVRLAAEKRQPDILITVDNGIASVDGVAEAARHGLKVLITDHHLPGEHLPDAWCIVNPNQPGCTFPSKSIAGVGVMFYLMLALRAELRGRGAFASQRDEPNLAELLDLVALGTVADVVRLDDNNRILVHQGLQRMRAGRAQPGINALFQVSGRDPRRASVRDLGFTLAPRLNAAGRLSDMALGIECLATADPLRASAIAAQLDLLNNERRAIEAEMQETALAEVERLEFRESCSITLYNPAWHQGVVGILASRIKDRCHRPVIAFARAGDGEVRGSGRSISGLHMRDALDLVAKRHPGLLLKFGGHAAAAGLTLREADLDRFCSAFEGVAQSLLTAADLEKQVETDGSLAPDETTLENALLLARQVWGHGFPEPRFHDRFQVLGQRVVGERHLRLRLARDRHPFDAILFGATPEMPSQISAIYRLHVNEFNGSRVLQLALEHWHAE
jgi:single-stranded-DNA-specific exonuclease